jgi:UDP:flavonoid glycosyltransferase YjiC (YdhE family)
MRVLVPVQPSNAHFWPITPTAWALQCAGHEVRVATHARYADSIRAAGLAPVALGDPSTSEPRTRPDARPPARPEEVLRFADVMGLDTEGREHWIAYYQWMLNSISDYLRIDLPYAAELVEFAQAWQPDLVLWDPFFACAPVAARACGAAHCRITICPDYCAWSFDRLAEHRDELVAAGLPENPQADMVRPLAEKYGIAYDDELLYGQWSIDPMPLGLGLTTSATRLPMRYVPFTGATDFPKWLHQRPRPPQRPRVALSLGDSTRRYIKGDWGRTPKILEAVAELDIEVVATLNGNQLDGVQHVPDNVRIIEWMPLTQLLPTCSAMIHHGGPSTFAAAWASKIPQIVCDSGETLMMRAVEAKPNALESGVYRIGFEFGVREDLVESVTHWEMPAKKLEATLTAGYVIAGGAGMRLNHLTQSVGEIREMIMRVVTEPSFRDGASTIFDTWLATPSPAEIVPLLERLTAEHRR